MQDDTGTMSDLRLAVSLNGYGLSSHGRRTVLPWRDLRQIVETAEETGYETVFTPEIGAREAFSTLTAIAGVTSRIGLASGVVPLGSRDLRRMAMEAATLQDLSGGRAILGLGSREPVADTREAIAAIRALARGEAAAGFAPLDLVPERLPVYLAALGPRMTELAGEVADGVVLNWCAPERVARAREEVAAGAARSGRDPAAVTICVYVRCVLGMGEGHALEALREATGEYAAMPRYRRQLETLGLGDEAEVAAKAWGAGRPDEVPEELVRSVCVLGGRDEGRAGLAAYRDAGADLVVVYPVPAVDAVSSIVGTMLAAAPGPSAPHRPRSG